MAYKDKSNAIKYNNNFIKEAYDRINLTVPKGRKAELQAVAERHGQSVNGFINSLIDDAMERERAGGVHVDVSAGTSPQAGIRVTSEPEVGTSEWWAARTPRDAQEGAGGGATGAGGISIFSDGEDTPSAAVGVSPMQDKESLSAEQLRQLSPDDWAVWAVRQDDESLESWKNRLNRSMRRLSVVDVAKRMGKLPEHERDILMGADPESIRLLRERDERERQRMEDASKPKKEEDLPF